ncbi:hypothetical protein ANO11243_019910 [Dothideomycetidae sp. 11243]|nr:hypothetical protein ANO11243_019910 [fungal sp. No.11243]
MSSTELEPITTAPSDEDFQLLEDYQSSTPASFFTGKPVLHHKCQCTLTLTQSELDSHPALSSLSPPPPIASTNNHGAPNGTSPTSDQSISIQVAALTATNALHLFSASTSAGVKIPYRAIALHARQANGVYLQLCLDDVRRVPDAELRTVEARLEPSEAGQAEKLFEAISECADLVVDDDDDEDGEGLGGGFGGEWITSENVHLFAGDGEEVEGEDEDEGEGLGPGAGTRRAAEEDEVEEGEGEGETKWRRTE